MHRPEVVLHVGVHVGVGGIERGLPRASRVRGKPNQGDIRDDGAAAQSGRPVGIKSSRQKGDVQGLQELKNPKPT